MKKIIAALGRHGKVFLTALFFGSIAYGVINLLLAAERWAGRQE